MAKNSKADRIVEVIKEALESLSSLKKVTRTPPIFNEEGQFEGVSATQMPIAFVVGGLPNVQSQNHRKKTFKSSLPVGIMVFIEDNVTPGQALYEVADDIWTLLMDQNQDEKGSYFDGLVYQFEVTPEQVINISPPYTSFRFDIDVVYFHTNGSI
jgi:hypothetical protein